MLYTDEPGDGIGTAMDPDTHKLELIAQQQTWSYFDLYWGTVIPEAEERMVLLQNGKTIGSSPSPEKQIEAGYHYYLEPPADLKAAFEKAAYEMEAQVPK